MSLFIPPAPPTPVAPVLTDAQITAAKQADADNRAQQILMLSERGFTQLLATLTMGLQAMWTIPTTQTSPTQQHVFDSLHKFALLRKSSAAEAVKVCAETLAFLETLSPGSTKTIAALINKTLTANADGTVVVK